MKRIPPDTAFTLWTRAVPHRVIKRSAERRTLEVLLGNETAAFFVPVPGAPLHVIGAWTQGHSYQVS